MNGVSLFANVGIAETYMARHGINIKVANELLKPRVKFYKQMHPTCEIIAGNITDEYIYNHLLREALRERCDFLIATPPCQGMSIAGKMKENDPRNSLIKYVIQMIQDLKPSYAIIENVPKILNTYLLHKRKKIKVVDFINVELKPLGYIINYRVVDAADYATPQTRKRAIFLISKKQKWEFPEFEERISVKDVIGHLPSLESGENSHIPYHYAKEQSPNHLECLKYTATGKSALDNEIHYPKKEDGSRIKGYATTYKRIDWHKPAPTITMANGFISSQNNVHPGVLKKDGTYSDARVLTLKEIFILTGLPEDWHPPAWASEQFIREVIGEGIPPLLIERLLRTMP
jgi:DNA (cytosine-5)-methyltransferase 1